ncbi:hypothetical protein N7532_004426 [Penicillium argentinense]|uniref:N-acetyltransferase domain-containing protein n=1 Tax=Penicillium argentinense TaxID=1131581 RepID=A0A9W9FPX8_9EURO|nr:uncharacterized protein N7532_004426 [Penicillium argentinense]KAJ5103897.1 hypothetical protein N7532_004426 [Penicillium argentinense]
MSSTNPPNDIGLRVELIDQPGDFYQAFDCVREAFGRQAQDGVWIAMNPGWDTPSGKTAGATRMASSWRDTTTNKAGKPNVMYLKATLPNPKPEGERIIAGIAIWAQASCIEGHGDPPAQNVREAMKLESLYPGNEREQRYVTQVMTSLHRPRTQVIKDKAAATPPAVMVLDLCAVHPAHQRKGIARALVQWGLDEAKRRGGLEAILEGSSMGRHVYRKMGFQAVEPEIEYSVDDEFASRTRPSNLFMRTHGSPGKAGR